MNDENLNPWEHYVRNFRENYGLPIGEKPHALEMSRAEMHCEMIYDEFVKEFVPAFMTGDVVEMYDAGIDVIVYILGAMAEAGFVVNPGFVEIMESNASKLDANGKPIYAVEGDGSGEPAGKVLKGPNYRPPQLETILRNQGWEVETL